MHDPPPTDHAVKFAYADPPYFGCGASHYGEHHPDAADWDERQTHLDLIARLTDESDEPLPLPTTEPS